MAATVLLLSLFPVIYGTKSPIRTPTYSGNCPRPILAPAPDEFGLML